MFSLPVYVDGEIDVSYIAKDICDKSVILPMYELALFAPCNVYSLLVLFKINSKLQSLIVFHLLYNSEKIILFI